MLRNPLRYVLMHAVLEQSSAGTVSEPVKTPEQIKQEAEAAAEQKEKLHQQIVAKFNNKVDIKETKFFFKKEDVEGPDPKDPTGEKKIKVGERKRPTIELPLPIPSVEGIVDILQNGMDENGKTTKSLELLLEAVGEVIAQRARDLINANESITGINDFPIDELDWAKIANLPKAERRGGGISSEVWEAFAQDYIAVMPALTGKSVEQVTNASKILLNKFNQVKTNKPVLKLMKEQLGLYITNSPNAETYSEAAKFLTEKVDTLLNLSDADLLKNL